MLSFMELSDTHTHTWLSGHGEGTVEQVVQAAVSHGLKLLALTEHLPLPPDIDPTGTFAMTADQVDLYLAEVAAARRAHPEIELLCGIEIDWRDGAEDFIRQSLAGHDHSLKHYGLNNYDMMIASVHMLSDAQGNFWEFDHPDLIEGWHQRGEDNVWQEYLRLWCDAARSQLPFTVMGHPDLPKKLGFKPRFDTREYYAAMAEAAAAKDRLVEVNTSGLRKPVGAAAEGFLRRGPGLHSILGRAYSGRCWARPGCGLCGDVRCRLQGGDRANTLRRPSPDTAGSGAGERGCIKPPPSFRTPPSRHQIRARGSVSGEYRENPGPSQPGGVG